MHPFITQSIAAERVRDLQNTAKHNRDASLARLKELAGQERRLRVLELRRNYGQTAALQAGFTRLRPVLMTGTAMIIGMIPMALGLGEGGEQNAPLGRAVIGGLLFATFATLIFVPTMYRLLRRRPAAVVDSNVIGGANATA